ncbi:hypothetical protein BKA70DRAFT_820380 [Coprinopsis sp. MPI-PUGE-AT-0042]|nr:hypothetical protein BKA70DRAFT_820380 [Coprinopsis sp. MPI-PUGE-AT-0042]
MPPLAGQTGLIALLGSTGSGKSSFANAIIGKPKAAVGNGLQSSTTNVEQHTHAHESGMEVHLVDTPGLNDCSTPCDTKVLQKIGAFLKNKYDVNQKFSGIIFMHNINTPTLDWQAQRRNVTLFKKLCGNESTSLNNVIVVTSFWDELTNEADGVQKESDLQTKDGFLKELHAGGAKFVRCGHFKPGEQPQDPNFYTPEQAVDYLLKLDPVYVEMQKERARIASAVDNSTETSRLEELEQLKRETRQALEKLGQDLEAIRIAGEVNKSPPEHLKQESEKILEKLDSWDKNGEDMRTSLAQLQIQVATKEELEALRREVMKLREANDALRHNDQRRNDDFNETLVLLRKDRDDLAEECRALRLGNEKEVCSQLRDLIASLATITCSHSPEMESLQAILANQAEELKQTKATFIQFQKKLEAQSELSARSQGELDRLQTLLKRSQEEAATWKESYEQLRSDGHGTRPVHSSGANWDTRSETETLRRELENMDFDRQALRKSYKESRDNYGALQGRHDELISAAHSAEQERDFLREELQEVHSDRRNLRESHERVYEDNANLKRKLVDLSDEARESRSQIDSLQHKLEAVDDERRAIEKLYEEACDKARALDRDHNHLHVIAQETKMELDHVRRELQEVHSDRHNLMESGERKYVEIVDLNRKLGELSDEARESQSRIESLHRLLDEANSAKQATEKLYEEAYDKARTLDRNHSQLLGDSLETKMELDRVRRELQEVHSDKHNLLESGERKVPRDCRSESQAR